MGAGFAGVYTAKNLQKKLKNKADIELINVNNYFVFQPLLPEVASGTLSAQDAVVPLRALVKGVRIRQAEVVAINREEQTISLLQGSRQTVIDLSYDHLVLTSGVDANSDFVKGMSSHSMTIKDLADAYAIRNHIIQCLEWADVTINPETKKRLLTFLVAGGGFSGVETMGEIVEMIHRALRYYPNINKDEIKPIIVQRGDALLPELHRKLGAYTASQFAKRGIEVVLGDSVETVTSRKVSLKSGRNIPAATMISSIGNKPPKFVESLGVELVRGKIPVQASLQLVGDRNVWALGDVALIPMDKEGKKFAPPTAQYAVQEAARCADNIVAQINGTQLKNFFFKPRGGLASLGSYSGVGEVFGIRLTGIVGWAVWRGFYILKIPGIATKIRITLNWLYDYFLPRNIVHLQQKQASSVSEMHFSKDDIVFHKGQLLDGLYVVKSGKAALSDGEGFTRYFDPGDHFGERLIEQNHVMTGDFVAVEDAVLLRFERKQFSELRDAMPVLSNYFDGIDETKYTPVMRDK